MFYKGPISCVMGSDTAFLYAVNIGDVYGYVECHYCSCNCNSVDNVQDSQEKPEKVNTRLSMSDI